MTRINCCVPFCKRSRENVSTDFNEWLCGEHWKLVDYDRRRVWGRINRRWRRFGPAGARPTPAYERLWTALKRQAMERAAGIG